MVTSTLIVAGVYLLSAILFGLFAQWWENRT